MEQSQSAWSPGGSARPAWAHSGDKRASDGGPKDMPVPGEKQLEVTIAVRRHEKYLEVKDTHGVPGVLVDAVKSVLTDLCRKDLLSMQGQKLFKSMADNPNWKRGYKGYCMLKKDGAGMTVKYRDVGLLAEKVHAALLPLKDGPFGGEGGPTNKAISKIVLCITDGPLHTQEFEAIEDFKAAVDALPDPAVPDVADAAAQDGVPTPAMLQAGMSQLWDLVEKQQKAIVALTTQVNTQERSIFNVERNVQLLQMRGRGVPQPGEM